MRAVAAAVVLQQQAGIEAIPHYTCKDKNLLALQADLLGAHALGIRNILLVTGDPPNMGTYPDATAVFNIDAIGLCNMVNLLNRGYRPGEQPRRPADRVLLRRGPQSQRREPASGRSMRIRQKLDAGAEFAITQPVFDAEALLRFLRSDGGHTATYPSSRASGRW